MLICDAYKIYLTLTESEANVKNIRLRLRFIGSILTYLSFFTKRSFLEYGILENISEQKLQKYFFKSEIKHLNLFVASR